MKSSPKRIGIKNNTPVLNRKEERNNSKGKAFRAQPDLLKTNPDSQHDGVTAQPGLSFADMIQDAAIERAVYGSLTKEKPRKWKGGVKGENVLSPHSSLIGKVMTVDPSTFLNVLAPTTDLQTL